MRRGYKSYKLPPAPSSLSHWIHSEEAALNKVLCNFPCSSNRCSFLLPGLTTLKALPQHETTKDAYRAKPTDDFRDVHIHFFGKQR
jgi:hypothetical protein